MKKVCAIMLCAWLIGVPGMLFARGASSESGIHVEVVSKGFQHQFWQVVKLGAEQAGKDLGASVNFDGPQSESDISGQVNMLNAALSKRPQAICLAALDTRSVTSQLQQAVNSGIPVIGFDSGVPNPPAGSVKATASTNNQAAAALAATEMMKNQSFLTKISAASASNPVVVGVIAQDATSSSQIDRTVGFINQMKAEAERRFPRAVAVTGHSSYVAPSAETAVINIRAVVPPTADPTDLRNAAQSLLNERNLIGVFLVNEGTVVGFLAATNDATDLAPGGRHAGLVVAGFDAGATQKNAVRQGWFIGSVTQDPYQIGYKAVDLAVKAANGQAVSDVDTGAKWYTAANMNQPDIAQLLYD